MYKAVYVLFGHYIYMYIHVNTMYIYLYVHVYNMYVQCV
jgi:hypothetical protein